MQRAADAGVRVIFVGTTECSVAGGLLSGMDGEVEEASEMVVDTNQNAECRSLQERESLRQLKLDGQRLRKPGRTLFE